MGRPSPKHTAEFKQRAAGLCRGRGRTCAELAREPGCDAGGMSDWVERPDAAGAAPGRDPLQMAEEPRGPRRENDRLGTESEMLLDHVGNVGVSEVDKGTAAAWNSNQPRYGFVRKATAAMDTLRQLPTHGDGLLYMGEPARTLLETMASEVMDAQADMLCGVGANARNGHRGRGLAAPVGDITLRIPELRADAIGVGAVCAEQDEDWCV